MAHRYFGRHAHFGQRAIHQIVKPHHASIQDGTRRPGQSDIARFDGVKRERGRCQKIAQLMCERSQLLIKQVRLIIGHKDIVLGTERGHGLGDAVVQTAVESSEFVCFDGHLLLKGQVGDGLTEITVVADNLLHRESVLK